MQRRSVQLVMTAIATATVATAIACSDPQITDPDALEAPVDMAVVDGEVCLPPVSGEDATIGVEPLPRCDDDGAGFALVLSQRSAKLGVLALGQEAPRWTNLDARRPGVTQISMPRRPVSLAVSGDATAALVASEADDTLTGIDLWTLRPLSESIFLAGTPKVVETMEGQQGEPLAVALTAEENRLEVRAGLECERPDQNTDRRDHVPDEYCAFGERAPESMQLPGQPVDMAIDEERGVAWVIYRDRDEISEIRVDGECLDEGVAPPCELDRLDWRADEDDEPDTWGATAVDVDPLGVFVYVLDRPNHRLLVFDRARGALINASESMEPPATPFRTDPGIPLLRSPMAMSAELDREIVDDSEAGHVVYRFGAQVAANNGQLYRVSVADVECVFDGEEPLDDESFFADADRRADHDESRCLQQIDDIPGLPEAFPLGGNPDVDTDDELREKRFFEPHESAAVAVTPVFSLRDMQAEEGRVATPVQCELPDELRTMMREELGDGAVLNCDSALIAQPIGLDVPVDLDDYADEARATLMEFATAGFDEEGEPVLERQSYDLRLRNEDWTVTYEGAIPDLGDAGDGLVSRDDDSLFLSSGTGFCSAGIEEGDRLTILSSPQDADGCEVFESDTAGYRTWEVVDVGPQQLRLEVLDEQEETAQQLPTRECFDRGVNYEVRPRDEWTVVGTNSGMMSPWERDGDGCALREEAEQGWFQGRVGSGEQFLGPYLRFQLREGQIEPVQGLSYTIGVERNFTPDAFASAPDEGTTLPSRVLFTPDVGAGRYLAMVDGGGDRLYLRNLTFTDRSPRFIR